MYLNLVHNTFECTHLGVRLDENLDFSSHIKYVTPKLSKYTAIHDLLSMEARLNYYYSLMYPYLIYKYI